MLHFATSTFAGSVEFGPLRARRASTRGFRTTPKHVTAPIARFSWWGTQVFREIHISKGRLCAFAIGSAIGGPRLGSSHAYLCLKN